MSVSESDGVVWCASSHGNGGGACVEVGWRTGSDGHEIELVRDAVSGTVDDLAVTRRAHWWSPTLHLRRSVVSGCPVPA